MYKYRIVWTLRYKKSRTSYNGGRGVSNLLNIRVKFSPSLVISHWKHSPASSPSCILRRLGALLSPFTSLITSWTDRGIGSSLPMLGPGLLEKYGSFNAYSMVTAWELCTSCWKYKRHGFRNFLGCGEVQYVIVNCHNRKLQQTSGQVNMARLALCKPAVIWEVRAFFLTCYRGTTYHYLVYWHATLIFPR